VGPIAHSILHRVSETQQLVSVGANAYTNASLRCLLKVREAAPELSENEGGSMLMAIAWEFNCQLISIFF
jgi:hypothetical protein